jgi:hypothetical protein
MNPPVEEPSEPLEERQEGQVRLVDEVGRTAAAIAEALTNVGDFLLPAGGTLRGTCEATSRRLSADQITFALVGDANARRRSLINALLGERVLPTSSPRRGSTVTIVHSTETLSFSARSLDGRSVAQLSRRSPDRGPLFDKSMAQLDRETEAKEQLAALVEATRQRIAELEADLRGRAPDDGAKDATRPPDASKENGAPLAVAERAAPLALFSRATLLWRALWSWILALVARWSSRWRSFRGKGSEDEAARASFEQRAMRVAELEEARASIVGLQRDLDGSRSTEQIAAHRERLRLERQRYDEERRAVFLAQARDFDGTDIAERVLHYPAAHLPRGFTLLDFPCVPAGRGPLVEQIRRRVGEDADALVVVSDFETPPSGATARLVGELQEVVPLALIVLNADDKKLEAIEGDARSRFEQLGSEAFDRVVAVLGGNVARTPRMLLAAEAALEGSPEPSPLVEHGRTMLAGLSVWLDTERPLLLAWREAMRIRAGIADVLRDEEREEKVYRDRLARLEGNRIPNPDEFRSRLLKRVESAIEKGTDDVLALATQRLQGAVESLRTEWKGRIASCTARSEVEACVAAINESAPGRISEKLEETAELVASELHNVTETLETWAIDEIHTHYRLVRRLGAEALAPVASELTGDDLGPELLSVKPFAGAVDAFEKGRVGYGLGGVAAGAVLGSLILPGIGTAVGAFLGVFAGFLKGTEALKQECTARIDACLNDSVRNALAQLQGKRADLSRVIRVSLDEALDEALRKLGDAITRLMATERKAIDAERAKLDRLTSLRSALEESDRSLSRACEENASSRNSVPSP